MMSEHEKEAVRIRWGAAVDGGFQPVPHLLFRYQSELELSNGEMVVLLNILDFWWQSDSLPFPGVPTLAKRMGVSNRSVQRAAESLERKGLIKRATALSPRGEERRTFDVGGLVSRLQEIARQAEAETWGSRFSQRGSRKGGVPSDAH